jgi:glutathione synthase
MSSPCVSHQQQVRLRLRAASRLPAPDTTSFAPPAPRRLRVAHAAMSAKAPLGVAPAEEGAGTPGQQAVLGQMVEDAAVWCVVHGLVVGDRANQVRHMSHPSRSWIDWLLVFVSVLAKACILGGLTLSENFL